MKEVEIFVGPCSKYITGQGWTTEVPVEQLKAKGWVKSEEIERLMEENKKLSLKVWNYERPAEPPFNYAQMANCNVANCYTENAEFRTRNAELQKQVDELKEQNELFKRLFDNANRSIITEDDIINGMNSLYREQADHLAGLKIEQAVKDTAKEILQKIMNIIKKSDCFLSEEVVRIMAKQNGVEVE